MDGSLYKELWTIRFNKMLELETRSVEEYQALLKECRGQVQDHAILPHLERMIRDEKKHAGLVRELLEILARQNA
jgi:rubrerythrin